MDNNLMWYKDKRIENLSKVLIDKEYVICKVDSLEEAKIKILSLLSKEKSVALGDTWELNDEEFLNKLRNFKFFDCFNRERNSCEIKRNSLIADISILEGEFVTEDGQVIVVGDYNTSSALFGAKNIIVLLSEDKIVKSLDVALNEVDQLEKYFKLRSEKLGNINDGLSIGIIENGRKFNKRITLVITR